MESNADRKEAVRKYKEQKVRLGAYAIRCTASGQVWVGSSRNLDATRNGCWFMLRSGSFVDKALQAEWNNRGEESFQYEVLEVLDEDVSTFEVADLLKEKKRHWVAQLSALPLL